MGDIIDIDEVMGRGEGPVNLPPRLRRTMGPPGGRLPEGAAAPRGAAPRRGMCKCTAQKVALGVGGLLAGYAVARWRR